MYGGGLYSINTYPKREWEREELYIEVEFRTIGTPSAKLHATSLVDAIWRRSYLIKATRSTIVRGNKCGYG